MKELLVLVTGAVIIVCSGIYAALQYNTKQLSAMQSNIESAIVKGIDPLAVKCAYGSGTTDAICIAYALRHSPDAPKK